jgi:hypothetical protein
MMVMMMMTMTRMMIRTSTGSSLGAPTYLFTPWTRVLLEQVKGSQLVKKFPIFYKVCSKKDQHFAIKTLLIIFQHFKHCPLQSSPSYWQYTIPNTSFTVGMLPGMQFL